MVEVWECDVDCELKQNDEMKHYFDHFHMVDPSNPRHALYGGRTNATKLYHCCQGDEQFRYVDFTSLYPHINRSKTEPTNHPEVITENFDEDISSNYFGLITARSFPSRAAASQPKQVDVCVVQDVRRYSEPNTVHAFRR